MDVFKLFFNLLYDKLKENMTATIIAVSLIFNVVLFRINSKSTDARLVEKDKQIQDRDNQLEEKKLELRECKDAVQEYKYWIHKSDSLNIVKYVLIKILKEK